MHGGPPPSTGSTNYGGSRILNPSATPSVVLLAELCHSANCQAVAKRGLAEFGRILDLCEIFRKLYLHARFISLKIPTLAIGKDERIDASRKDEEEEAIIVMGMSR